MSRLLEVAARLGAECGDGTGDSECAGIRT